MTLPQWFSRMTSRLLREGSTKACSRQVSVLSETKTCMEAGAALTPGPLSARSQDLNGNRHKRSLRPGSLRPQNQQKHASVEKALSTQCNFTQLAPHYPVTRFLISHPSAVERMIRAPPGAGLVGFISAEMLAVGAVKVPWPVNDVYAPDLLTRAGEESGGGGGEEWRGGGGREGEGSGEGEGEGEGEAASPFGAMHAAVQPSNSGYVGGVVGGGG